MTRRGRFLSFGAGGVLVVAGLLCGFLIGGGAGQVSALVLIGVGLVVVVSLVFYEVGLSEDRERARELRVREDAERRKARPPATPRKRPALGRMRGRRRRLD